jgi:hypothetical protein
MYQRKFVILKYKFKILYKFVLRQYFHDKYAYKIYQIVKQNFTDMYQ